MDRRKFIILTGVGATSAGVFSACGHPEEKLIPALIPDEEYIPGIDYWKASACGMCAAGCGIIVRTREHKANKIEGNPLHPVNRGALCAKGQAGLQVLYNPDRIRGPMRRSGERGSGQFEEITWDEAIKTLANKLREIQAEGRATSTLFLTAGPIGVDARIAAKFMEAYGARAIITWALFNENLLGSDDTLSYGGTPVFDIANATYLLSFGARFLETWQSPVMYSRAYGEFRSTPGRARGRFVQIEPRMSMTGANADQWLPAKPGSEWMVALAIAQVIIREGVAKNAPSPAFIKALEEYAPEKTTDRTDITPEKIIRVAREFATSERPLAIAAVSPSEVPANTSLKWINFLNLLVDNLNKRGGVLVPEQEYFDPLGNIGLDPPSRFFEAYLSDWRSELDSDATKAFFVHQVNPVYFTPDVADKIKEIPFIASFSSFMDETTQLADLILPDHSFLEKWDIRATRSTTDPVVVSLTKPVITPEFNTRQTTDVLLAVSRELGGTAARLLPFGSAEDVIKKASTQIPKQGGSIAAQDEDEFWKSFVESGVWIAGVQQKSQGEKESASAKVASTELLFQTSPPSPSVSESEYPFRLLTYEHATLGDGSFANLPWLQELPDPMTSVMWGSWVEINPKTAAELSIADGDIVEITTRYGSARLPVVLYPAIRPDVIAMPYGQGHTAYGRYASGRGVSAMTLDSFTGYTPEIIQAKVEKIAGKANIIRFGTMLPEHIKIKR